MRSFASDNNSSVHPLVMEALSLANRDHAIGYGDDPWTTDAIRIIRETFTPDCEPFFVFNGTGSNILALQTISRPFNSIICAETAHIYVDECGAPVKSTGCQIVALKTMDGKLLPEQIAGCIHGLGVEHHSQPGVVYLSQCTELGTIYTEEELKAITALAHQHGMYVHMDGARLANASAKLQRSFKALTVDCGIDVLSFGGTKNGLMMGESVLVFNPELAKSVKYIRKQSAQLASKMRYLSVQFTAYLTDDLWLKNATQANDMAWMLYQGLKTLPGVTFTQKVESNAIFLTMPREVVDRLLEKWFFYFWNEAANEIRLVASFDTTKEDVLDFLKEAESLLTS